MSMYHVLGITHKGNLQALTSKASKEDALALALEFAAGYRQLFLMKDEENIREVTYTPPTEGGWEEGAYSPTVHDLDLDAPL